MNNKLISEMLTWTDTPGDLYTIWNEDSLLYRIEDIERLCRQSREYKGWVYWKKTKHTQVICKKLNINIYDYTGVHIEQDHFPITLYDIVLIIGMKMISELPEDGHLTAFDIASVVMQEHLDEHNYIGTVSLTTTSHQLRHNNAIDLNKEDINGNYEAFLYKYRNHIPTAVQERIDFNLRELDIHSTKSIT